MSDFEHSLFQKLNSYAQSDFYPFHMPGHKRNEFLTSRTGEVQTEATMQSNALSPESIDITEITGFDDLHHPEGILKEAQERMADVFGAHKSFFLVNGSTAGILAAICACTKKGGRILMARNCHKSVYHAALLQELSIDYLYPDVTEYGIAGSILPEMVSRRISDAQISELLTDNSSNGAMTYQNENEPSHYQAIVITSPTYDGIVSDIAAIADIAHAHHIPLIVDEAHGAHFGFSDGFPKKAHSCGADIVIESIHKTLSALTQSAALHIADSPYIDEEKIKRYLSIFQTSSPSYVLMAGLDQCTQLLQTQSAELFSAFEKKLTAFYEKAASLKNICVLFANEHLQVLTDTYNTDKHLQHLTEIRKSDRATIYQKDPSKILISADNIGMTGGELFAVLRDNYHLELEMASLHYVTALTSIMDTQEGFDRLIHALEEIDRMDLRHLGDNDSGTETTCICKTFASTLGEDKEQRHATPASSAHLNIIPEQETTMRLFEATNQPGKSICLASASGKISADFIIPYPPGIPLLVPGEQITDEHIGQISRNLENGITVYGIG